MYRLGVIGAGNMGMAILNGAITSGAVNAPDVAVYDLDAEKQKVCLNKGVRGFLRMRAKLFKKARSFFLRSSRRALRISSKNCLRSSLATIS